MGTVFAYTGATNPAGTVAKLPKSVAGVSWVIPWSAVEPKQGVYDWSIIDACLSAATAAHKLSMLRVIAGEQSPSWLPGRVSISYTPQGPMGPRTITMPLPWDTKFLSAWTAFIAAYGRRYNANTDIAIVQMPGAGHQGEMSLPEGTPAWSSLGYTDARILAAWTTIIDAYLAAFPRTLLAMDLGEPLSTSAVMLRVHDYVLSKAPRICTQENGLRAQMPQKYPQLLAADSAHTATGWQAWGSLASGAGPLAGLLTVATQSRASYLEIYAVDAAVPANASALAAWAAASPVLR